MAVTNSEVVSIVLLWEFSEFEMCTDLLEGVGFECW